MFPALVILSFAVAIMIAGMVTLTRRVLRARREAHASVMASRSPPSPQYRTAPGLHYHGGHTWAHLIPTRDAVVGMDDFARRVIGRIDRVDLPAPGTAIQAGRTAFTVVQGDRRIDFMAPFDGRVCALNELVNPNIGRLAEDPYGWGWLMRVRPDDPANLSHELTPTDAPEAWMGKEAARLMAFVAPRIHVPAEIGRTMHDGGAFVDGLVEVLDDDTVQKLVQEFFR